VSGPARRPRPAPERAPDGLALGVASALGGVADSRHLDRLIRGRAWIGIIAFALIGIVTLQLLLLQLNAGIGRTIVKEDALARENAALSIEDSELSSGHRVETLASRLGMVLVPVGALKFLHAGAAPPFAAAAAAMRAPSAEATGPEGAAAKTAPAEAQTQASTESPSTAAAAQSPAASEGAAVSQVSTAAAATTPAATPPAATAPSEQTTATSPPPSTSVPGATEAGG